MAEEEKPININLLKKTRISVFVDEALPDILVVTYEHGVKIFKGVLLDSTKRNLPNGVQTLNPAFKVPAKSKPDDDPLYSVNQRFAYTDPSTAKKRNVQMPSKYKNNKMTVRLRPRQVLCSKCKGICNENSENVSRKRKLSAGDSGGGSASASAPPAPPPVKRGLNAPMTRSYSEFRNKKKVGEAMLVPKLTRLTPEEELSAMTGGNISKLLAEADSKTKTNSVASNKENTEDKHSSDHSDDSSNSDNEVLGRCLPMKSDRKTLRKKRSVGSVEDFWDDPAPEDDKKNNPSQPQSPEQPLTTNCTIVNTTRTIKISYGPQGEGTVLKIPAQISAECPSEENLKCEDESSSGHSRTLDNKAARRAMKKAKKEARRKVFLAGSSPLYLGGGSPRYTIGGSSPRYTVGSASPRHGLGNNSPRYAICPSYDFNVPRRRKHKMKHKKKHKDDKDRKHKEGEVSSTQEEAHKETCVTQKLSINLKRLNNTYTSYPSVSDKERVEENTSSSDEYGDQVPNFPPPNPPLMLRINSQTLTSAPKADGSRIYVGDVVWGKIHGFPWWPGKVLTISNCGMGQAPQAHVSWYGSCTSSFMQCDQLSPYLENFKTRHNKKKKGAYKEAVKQATLEAKENADSRVRQPLSASPSQHNIIPQVVPPALASPREIDVAS